jgi:hypothetical protein
LLASCGGTSDGDTRDANTGSSDKVKPIITLNGDNLIVIEVGDSFKEPGASAIDNVDGVIPVTVSGSVDNTTVGTYPLKYFAKDKAGNEATKLRHVIVDPVTIVHQVSNVADFRDALINAANNHTSDIILLQKGVYKTTQDSQGTFRFSDSEKYNLTIMPASGLNREDVVLDGDFQDLVLSYNSSSSIDSTPYTTLRVESITIKNGINKNTSNGAGVYSSRKLHLKNCHIINNKNIANSGAGAGVHVRQNAIIEDSLINNNKAYSSAGVSIVGFAEVINTTISGNESSWVGGGITAGSLFIKNSTVSYNKAKTQVGGLSGRLTTVCENTTISYNQSNAMAAMSGGSNTILKNCIIRGNKNNLSKTSVVSLSLSYIVNTIFVENKGRLLSSTLTTMVNNTLINNDGNSHLSGRIINNIFDTGINFTGNSKLYNNYIDPHLLTNHDQGNRVVIRRNNIQPSDGLLALDTNLTPAINSVLINNGLNIQAKGFKEIFPENEKLFNKSQNGLLYKTISKDLQKDYQGKNRIVGGTIDIGANEKQ